MIYLILILVLLVLLKDNSSTKGFFLQKIFHVIALIVLYYLHQKSYTAFISLFKNFGIFFDRFYINFGYIPPFVTFAFFLINKIANMLIIILLFGLIIRTDIFRKIIIRILLISIISSFYLVFFYFYKQKTNERDFILLIISILFILADLGLFFLYKSNFMKVFFQALKSKPLPPTP